MVLVVIDMQNGFLGDKSRHIIRPVVELVRAFTDRKMPIIFTRFHNEPGSPYETLMGWKRLRFSPEIDLTDELKPYASTVIDKGIYSAFTPAFAAETSRRGWKTMVLCGVATDGCVLKTAVDAFERGLVPIVAEDACASHAGEEVHRAGLMLLGKFIGQRQIMTLNDILGLVDDHRGE